MRQLVIPALFLALPSVASAACVFDGSPSAYVRCIYEETVALWDAVGRLDEEPGFDDLCDRVSRSESEWTYIDLNDELSADPSGHGVCGAGAHVCNVAEAELYGILGKCAMNGEWLVGGFSNTEYHRRSIWNGQDSTQCDEGRYPTWYGAFHGYKGRIHCGDQDIARIVACCVDL